jgi:hypothetical protein
VSRRVGCRVAWSSTSGVTNDLGRFAASLAMKDVGLWPPYFPLRRDSLPAAEPVSPTCNRVVDEPGGGSRRFAWSCMARITSLPSSCLAPKERQGGRS